MLLLPNRTGHVSQQRRPFNDELIKRALECPLYAFQKGPNSFLVRGESGSKKKYRVNIGPQTCTCGRRKCLHILFVMLRVLRIATTSPLLWQPSLKNYEVEQILEGYRLRLQEANADAKARAAQYGKKQTVARRDIQGEECPICLSGLEDSPECDLTWCMAGCGNNVHKECMQVWIEEKQDNLEEVLCPLCRHPWKDSSLLPAILNAPNGSTPTAPVTSPSIHTTATISPTPSTTTDYSPGTAATTYPDHLPDSERAGASAGASVAPILATPITVVTVVTPIATPCATPPLGCLSPGEEEAETEGRSTEKFKDLDSVSAVLAPYSAEFPPLPRISNQAVSGQDRERILPLLGIFDESLLRCVMAKKWHHRVEAVKRADGILNMLPANVMTESIFSAYCHLLKTVFNDKVSTVYQSSLPMLRTLIDQYTTHLDATTVRHHVRPVISPLIDHCGDMNPRVRDESRDSVMFLAASPILMSVVYGHLVRDEDTSVVRRIIARASLLTHMLQSAVCGEFLRVAKLDSYFAFCSRTLRHPNRDVRRAGISCTLEIYRRVPTRTKNFMETLRPALREELMSKIREIRTSCDPWSSDALAMLWEKKKDCECDDSATNNANAVNAVANAHIDAGDVASAAALLAEHDYAVEQEHAFDYESRQSGCGHSRGAGAPTAACISTARPPSGRGALSSSPTNHHSTNANTHSANAHNSTTTNNPRQQNKRTARTNTSLNTAPGFCSGCGSKQKSAKSKNNHLCRNCRAGAGACASPRMDAGACGDSNAGTLVLDNALPSNHRTGVQGPAHNGRSENAMEKDKGKGVGGNGRRRSVSERSDDSSVDGDLDVESRDGDVYEYEMDSERDRNMSMLGKSEEESLENAAVVENDSRISNCTCMSDETMSDECCQNHSKDHEDGDDYEGVQEVMSIAHSHHALSCTSATNSTSEMEIESESGHMMEHNAASELAADREVEALGLGMDVGAMECHQHDFACQTSASMCVTPSSTPVSDVTSVSVMAQVEQCDQAMQFPSVHAIIMNSSQPIMPVQAIHAANVAANNVNNIHVANNAGDAVGNAHAHAHANNVVLANANLHMNLNVNVNGNANGNANGNFLPVSPVTQVNSSWNVSCEDQSYLSDPVLRSWHIDDFEQQVEIDARIGTGAYGAVMRAKWNGTVIAVKQLNTTAPLDENAGEHTLREQQQLDRQARHEFLHEVKSLACLRHPNLILFMGFSLSSTGLNIVTEFMARGSLYRILRKQERSKVPLDAKLRDKVAMGVARGMNYLHTRTPSVVHRDLKSPNILVSETWEVKVADFGLCRILNPQVSLREHGLNGTPGWMPPEMLRSESHTCSVDVFSYGVVLWELLSLQVPWDRVDPLAIVSAVGYQGKRLPLSESMDARYRTLIQDCWHPLPTDRPSFAQIIQRIESWDITAPVPC
eukprot:TRINITY_DN4181_c0_g1::TRINITY_DN4181_c0_g1_i1::g.2095::m.2095 TRINITY_DN4181_c0_g1::TRINITY_DN4181_c0_g1_i1::g.2095  ORF type:complete len:1422 (-),score=286.12,sp/Q9FPR3/EDR1_ARATH/43.97/4e-63,Pkinase_Tyr/PF07714.12/7.9e-55,Pkinase/PF00069.20/2.1e-50,zf-RING_2/PF13639.1/1.9e-07,zf-RING_2/PF13639.1/9.6e+03,zf-rbx1/PF12678.2/8.5e-05,zf-rbx1/PF12678.2/1.1e+04,CLASP_N/PF12348.3/0.0028,SWIM/PF04434.12/0.0071,SWIM/PF04434.12/4.6e+03,zf-Apc11/PF12861.2/0.0075,APH/PF01636.18/0.019,Kinase-like/PF14531.1